MMTDAADPEWRIVAVSRRPILSLDVTWHRGLLPISIRFINAQRWVIVYTDEEEEDRQRRMLKANRLNNEAVQVIT